VQPGETPNPIRHHCRRPLLSAGELSREVLQHVDGPSRGSCTVRRRQSPHRGVSTAVVGQRWVRHFPVGDLDRESSLPADPDTEYEPASDWQACALGADAIDGLHKLVGAALVNSVARGHSETLSDAPDVSSYPALTLVGTAAHCRLRYWEACIGRIRRLVDAGRAGVPSGQVWPLLMVSPSALGFLREILRRGPKLRPNPFRRSRSPTIEMRDESAMECAHRARNAMKRPTRHQVEGTAPS
jgi:hypothetical protein